MAHAAGGLVAQAVEAECGRKVLSHLVKRGVNLEAATIVHVLRCLAEKQRRYVEIPDVLLDAVRRGIRLQPSIFEAITKQLREKAAFEDARKVLRVAFKADIGKSVRMWEKHIKCLKNDKHFIEAQWAHKELLEATSASASLRTEQIVNRAAHTRDFSALKRLTAQIAANESEIERQEVWNRMIAAYAEKDDIVNVLKCIRKMEDLGVKLTSFPLFTMLTLYAKRGNVTMVEETLRRMKQVSLKINEKCCALLMTAYALRGQRLEGQRRLYEEMKANELSVTAASVNSIIYSLLQSGSVDEAELLMRDMKLNGIVPNALTYNMFMAYFAKFGELAHAEKLLDDMNLGGIKPNAVTIGTLMQTLSVQGDAEQAERILQTMKRRFGISPTVAHQNILIGAYIRRGDDASLIKAEKLLHDMPTKDHRSFQPLVLAYAKRKDLNAVIFYLRAMVDSCGPEMEMRTFKICRASIARAAGFDFTSMSRKKAGKILCTILEGKFDDLQHYI